MSKRTLRAHDANASGENTRTFELLFCDPEVSLRDIITERAQQTVEQSNWYSLWDTSRPDSSALLKLKLADTDAESEIDRAIEAFEKRLYSVVVDNVLLTNLDDRVVVNKVSTITFVRMAAVKGR